MYKKVLAAVDFSETSRKVLDAALTLTNDNPANIHLIHVIQPVTEGYALKVYTENFQALEDEAVEQASAQLKEFEKSDMIPGDQMHTVVGDRAGEIRRYCADIEANIIVIGSHGHSGQRRMLGATANKLLHGAKSDILTVHAGD
jgi:universal stress protein A